MDEYKKGVRQRCVASHHLFAMYTEMIMISLKDKGGFRIGGRVINNLRYADDSVILAETDHELQHLWTLWYKRANRKDYSSA